MWPSPEAKVGRYARSRNVSFGIGLGGCEWLDVLSSDWKIGEKAPIGSVWRQLLPKKFPNTTGR
jgi:hypothetical protein